MCKLQITNKAASTLTWHLFGWTNSGFWFLGANGWVGMVEK